MITLHKDPFFQNLDKLFETVSYNNFVPKTNIRKNENEYKLFMSVPGLTKEDLKIKVKDNTLTISYEKDEKDEKFTFVSSFEKSYTLDDSIKDKDIVGKVENGILELTLPLEKMKLLERLISLN